MKIRMAETADFPHIGALYVKNHISTYTGLLSERYLSGLTVEYGVAKWSEYAKTEGNRLWVAEEDGVFLGFAAGKADEELPGTWYLDSLHVTAGARGKGVGTQLIRTVGAYAAENGYTRMSICIVRGNDTAGALYQKMGAAHYSYFEDDFSGTPSQSEKLVWGSLDDFR